MRNYWFRIFAGAFGIFAVGMLIVTGFRRLKHEVTSTINSTDPIPIPLVGLLPFRVDNDKLGSLRRVEFLRQDPEHFSGVRVVVKLSDSVSATRFEQCRFVVDDVEHINDRTTFKCESAGTVPAGLEPFGEVEVQGHAEPFPLYLPGPVVAELRRTVIRLDHGGLHVNTTPDPARVAMEARLDSLRDAIEARVDARSDSVDELRDRADALEDSSASLPAGPRRLTQRQADSVRTLMRATIDRMKSDEARLQALKHLPDFGGGVNADSVALSARRMTDSIMQAVQMELQRAGVGSPGAAASTTPGQPALPPVKPAAGATAVEAPAPPAPPKP